GTNTRSRRAQIFATAGGLFALVAILAFAAPQRSRASWTPLLKPVATIKATALAPLAVEPGDVQVERGSNVDVVIGAKGRDAVTLYWKQQGDVLHDQTLPILNGQ